MLVLNADQVRTLAPMPHLIERLERAFAEDCFAPPRQVVKLPGAGERLFVCMPAFAAESGAVKLATIFPGNEAKGLPTIQAVIVVFSKDGTPIAMVDGTVVTKLRTGAASALASKYLSRADSSHLVMMGTGALAPYMVAAHCAVRPIKRVAVWGRNAERVAGTMAAIRELVPSIQVDACDSPEKAVRAADIVCCATRSPKPVLAGKWLAPGTFVDLVGSFSPTTRESDDDVVLRARIFVDTHEGASAEAGDILDPVRRGVISKDKVEGELADLVTGRVKGRSHPDEITMFKSVGTAIEDVAAAQMIVEAAQAAGR